MITLRPNHESNACHNPSGAGGGQFCGHKAFADDLATLGFWNPMNNREFVMRNEAGVELTPTPDGFRVNAIRAFTPGQGAGTRTMQTLLDLADKHHAVLEGGAKPFKTGKSKTLTKAQLVKWYTKLGFTVKANGEMIRHPK